MESYANNSIFRVEWSINKGFHVVSNINSNGSETLLLSIPHENIFTSYDDFLFKDELIQVLSMIPEINDTTKNKVSSLFSGLLLGARLYIEKYISIKKLKKELPNTDSRELFSEKSVLNKMLLDSFPETISILKNWPKEDIEFYNNLTFSSPYQPNVLRNNDYKPPKSFEFDDFYFKFIDNLDLINDRNISKFLKKTFNNQKRFEWCYDVIKTRYLNYQISFLLIFYIIYALYIEHFLFLNQIILCLHGIIQVSRRWR